MFIHVAQVIGRILMGLIFVVSGFGKITHWSQMHGYMVSKGIPLASFFLGCALAIEIVCGLSLVVGYRFRQGALILCFFLIPVTFLFHNFWSHIGPEAQAQMAHFLKNLSIMGGLLTISTLPPQR